MKWRGEHTKFERGPGIFPRYHAALARVEGFENFHEGNLIECYTMD